MDDLAFWAGFGYGVAVSASVAVFYAPLCHLTEALVGLAQAAAARLLLPSGRVEAPEVEWEVAEAELVTDDCLQLRVDGRVEAVVEDDRVRAICASTPLAPTVLAEMLRDRAGLEMPEDEFNDLADEVGDLLRANNLLPRNG